MTWLLRVAASAAALWVASLIIDGVEVTATTTGGQVLTLLAVALVFGIVNAVVKPVVRVITCPFYVLTLGLFTFVVNALLLWLTGALSSGIGLEFDVEGFWPAFWGAIVVSVVSFALALLLPDRD